METQEQSHIGTSANETNNKKSGKAGILKQTTGDENIPNLSSETIGVERDKIRGTPFEIMSQEQIGYWLGMGVFRLSEPKETKEEVEEIIKNKEWDTIINVMCAIMASRDMELIKQSQKNQFETPKEG